jgi:tetratricopeptide (TPR) repeat protein
MYHNEYNRFISLQIEVMGKKSKRNRVASKKQQIARVQQGGVTNTSSATSDVAAAAAVVGNEIEPRSSASIRIDPIDSLIVQLAQKDDFEGILKLESKLVLRATALEGTEPRKAGYIYLMVANALIANELIATEFLSKISREKAIHYLEGCWKVIHSLDEIFVLACARDLVTLYLQEERHDEAFVTMKRLTVRIPQHELIDPDLILYLASELHQAALNEKVIEILTIFLGTINRSWDKEKRAKAYLAFGKGYSSLAEYEKAASFLHKARAITDDPECKVAALLQMGFMSRWSCNYDDALAALNQALAEILVSRNKSTKSWSENTAVVYQARVHTQIGEVLSDWGKRDLEAVESFERGLVIMKEDNPGDVGQLATMYHGIGVVHARLGNWDEAIDYLKLAYTYSKTNTNAAFSRYRAILCKDIGRVRLDQYFWDERLFHDTQERENVLTEAAIFSQKSVKNGSYLKDSIIDCAQVAYFKTEIEDANKLLMAYFESEMKKQHGIYCRSCKRKAGNGTDIKICRNCQVVDYCSEAHQTLAWRRGRLSHKVMCPFLKRYRLVSKAENQHIDTDTESYEDICKDFFETVCVFKYEV